MSIVNTLRLLLASVIVLAIQVAVLSPMSLLGVAVPHLYPVLLMLIPVGARPIRLLWISFTIGMLLDMLLLTPGLHASALTLAGFLRYYFLSPMLDRGGNLDVLPTFASLGARAYFLYAEVLIVHHIVLYALDMGLHFDFVTMSMRCVAGLLVSYALGVLVMLLLSIRANRR